MIKFKIVVISGGEVGGWDEERIQCISSILFIKFGDGFLSVYLMLLMYVSNTV